jgi:hypothetical protein
MHSTGLLNKWSAHSPTSIPAPSAAIFQSLTALGSFPSSPASPFHHSGALLPHNGPLTSDGQHNPPTVPLHPLQLSPILQWPWVAFCHHQWHHFASVVPSGLRQCTSLTAHLCSYISVPNSPGQLYIATSITILPQWRSPPSQWPSCLR